MKQKIIITGGSGLLAVNWAYKIKETFDVLLFTHDHAVNVPGVSSKIVDLSNITSIARELKKFNVDVVVHTAGMTNVDECEKNPELAYKVNVKITDNVARACVDTGKKLVHISTDHLFDGSKSLVSEEEPINPMNVYGDTKAQAEDKVFNVIQDALIIRTNFYGWGHEYKKSLSDWVIDLLERKLVVPAFNDSYFSPVFFGQLIDGIHALLDKGHTGIFNICSNERVSKYSFAKVISEVFEFDSNLIKPTRMKEACLYANRPYDMSLSNKKLSDVLGRDVGGIHEGILALKNSCFCRNDLKNAVTII